MEGLHCGACMADFKSIKDLNKHVEMCPAAITMLPVIDGIIFGADKMGHPLSHMIQNLHRNAALIKRYAHCIADEMDSLSRSKIHSELCNKLGFDYNKFRPFESSDIREMPNREEAEVILWTRIAEEIKKI